MAAPVYTDFNIVWQKEGDMRNIISLAIKLGYERVAINNFITDLKGGKKQKEKVAVASPSEVKLSEEDFKSLQLKHGKKCEQLSRFTALLGDASNTHRLSSSEIQSYDILAVQPTDEKTFQLACSTLEIDIITFDLSEPLGFVLKRPLLKLAAERGIHFEIRYSKALQDSNCKRQTLSNAMNLVQFGKGKNIILSSGTDQPINLRSPYDVINLSKILGLDHVQAKHSITKNCRAVVMHAVSRKSCKSVITASLISKLPKADKWVVEAHNKLMDGSDSEEEEEEDEHKEESSESDHEDVTEVTSEPRKKRLKI